MIDPAQIPDEVVDAAERTYRTVPLWTSHADSIRAAIAAALEAWPGMDYRPGAKVNRSWTTPGKIILPLPQEASDE
jgi:hypothetical protein